MNVNRETTVAAVELLKARYDELYAGCRVLVNGGVLAVVIDAPGFNDRGMTTITTREVVVGEHRVLDLLPLLGDVGQAEVEQRERMCLAYGLAVDGVLTRFRQFAAEVGVNEQLVNLRPKLNGRSVVFKAVGIVNLNGRVFAPHVRATLPLGAIVKRSSTTAELEVAVAAAVERTMTAVMAQLTEIIDENCK